MTTDALYSIYLDHRVISTDTRSIPPGSLFFALKGERFNANAFAAHALEAGAAYAIIDDPQYAAGDRYLLVNDVLTALQDLAAHHRRHLAFPVIGITGTNGKTTTKELIAAVLGTRFRTEATKGNLNNHIGVPLTILSISEDTEVAVIEMGANHQREIAFLSRIAQPTHGLITNVGKAHLEGFGGFDGVKIGKGELYTYLAESGGTVFINRASSDLAEMLARTDPKHVIGYHGPDAAIDGNLLGADPYLQIAWTEADREPHPVQSQLTGSYNLDNILAAVCIGRHFGLSADEVTQGIENYRPANNRSQMTDTGRNRLICDYYNANPTSMVVALDNLQLLSAEKKALILGDMFELGEDAAAEHRAVLEHAFDVDADRRIFIGNEFWALSGEYPDATFYQTTEQAAEALENTSWNGFTVLLKGSRSMKLERLLPAF